MGGALLGARQKEPHDFCLSRCGAHLHAQRAFQDFAASADEARLDGRERPASAGSNRRRAPGNYRGHLSFAQHAGAACAAEISCAAARAAGTIAAENFRESCRLWMLRCANRNSSRASKEKAAGTRSCACRSPEPTKTSPSLCSNAARCWCIPATSLIFRGMVFWCSA